MLDHIFSPNDQLPLVAHLMRYFGADLSDAAGTGLTPTQVLSTRKSLRGASIPPPRSSSPRKTGINGSPRRSNGVDVLALAKGLPVIDPEDRENTPVLTPTRPAQSNVRRFSPSPEKPPLREVTTNGPASSRLAKGKQRAAEPLPQNHVNHPGEDVIDYEEDKQMMDRFKPPRVVAPQDEDYNDFAPQGDDDEVSMNADLAFAPQVGLTPEDSDEQMHESIEIDEKEDFPPKSKAPNNRGARKRKSDSLEEDENLSSHEQSPPHQGAKKTKTATNKQPKAKNSKTVDYGFPLDPALAPGVQDEPRGRPAAKGKVQNPLLSTQQEAELGQIIERVKARPGQQKSLYILRRETPADDSAVHTRSGRVSVRPLAYWRNERCVYGGSPSGANLPEGARFPLNSIKEIIRTEEVDSRRSRSPSKGKRKGKKGNKGKGKGRAGGVENDTDSDSDSASNSDVDGAWIDPEAEEWEANSGIYRGDVSIWDYDQQAPLDALEEVELAYAPASIQTKEVKSMHPDQRTFKFAKLLSISFFGSGIVELEPGDFKRPKNSRKMHMSFFVAKGRVTVEVGPLGGEMCRFSVGKGGFWQVPRGESVMPFQFA
jgi:centromere protein C